MPSPGFEPAIPSLECPQTYALGKFYNGARTDTTQESGQSPDKQVKTSHFFVHVSGYTETDPTGVLSPNNWLLSGLKKMGLFGADSIVRHLQQSEYNLSVGAMDTTYLLERVICVDAASMGPRDRKTSSRSVGMHYGIN